MDASISIDESDLDAYLLREVTNFLQAVRNTTEPVSDHSSKNGQLVSETLYEAACSAILAWAHAALLHLPQAQQADAERRAIAALARATTLDPARKAQLGALCIHLACGK
jgi:hypothetical protein